MKKEQKKEPKKVLFYSYKPFLQLCPCIDVFFYFDADCKCVVTEEKDIEMLRSYAEDTKRSYIITEEGSGMDLSELQRLHEENEIKLIHEAEEREQKRIKAEMEEREKRELFSLLRM